MEDIKTYSISWSERTKQEHIDLCLIYGIGEHNLELSNHVSGERCLFMSCVSCSDIYLVLFSKGSFIKPCKTTRQDFQQNIFCFTSCDKCKKVGKTEECLATERDLSLYISLKQLCMYLLDLAVGEDNMSYIELSDIRNSIISKYTFVEFSEYIYWYINHRTAGEPSRIKDYLEFIDNMEE